MHLPIPIGRFMPLMLALLTITGCSRKETASNASPPPPAAVKLATVEPSNVQETAEYIGNLQSRKSVTLQPQVDGQVTKIFVGSGQTVAAGTPLIQINPNKQSASVSSFIAAAESNRADLDSAKQILQADIADRASKVSALKFQQQQYNRYVALGREGAVSLQIVDQYRSQLDAAQSALLTSDAQINAQKAVVARTQRNLQQAEANIKQQQVELQYYRITAPFAGTVGDYPIKVGDYVTPASQLVKVTQNSPIEIDIQVPAERAAQLRTGLPVQVLDTQGKVLGQSTISFISPSVNTQSQSVLVIALYDNANGQLRADQTVRSRVIWDTKPGLLIPTTAISRVAGENFVYVAAPGKQANQLVAQQKPVKLGTIQGNSYQVLDGLQAGDKIIVSGLLKLSNGAPIQPQS
jgi:RND family efflux transporter MFP subunit